MRWLMSLAALLAACTIDHDYERIEVVIEPVSPPVPNGGEPVAVAIGDVVLTQHYISKDGGATWAGVNPQIEPAGAQAGSPNDLYVFTTAFGLGRWDMTTDLVGSLDVPLESPSRTFHARRATGTLFVADASRATIARLPPGGAWSTMSLTQPEGAPATATIRSFASNGSVILAIASGWGVFRSQNDGVSWELVPTPANVNATYLVALEDGRFLVKNPDRTHVVLDATGVSTGVVTPAAPSNEAELGCLGGHIVGDKISRDLGMTWEDIIPALAARGFRPFGVACREDDALVYVQNADGSINWIVPVASDQTIGAILGYPDGGLGAPQIGPDFVLLADGTALAGGLAWKPGDAGWSLRFLPDGTPHVLADGSLLVVGASSLHRSRDAGATFEEIVPTAPLPPADRFFALGDELYASAGDAGAGAYSAQLWRSADGGASWTQVFDRTSTTEYPEPDATDIAPRVVEITADGTFVATSFEHGLHVSRDRGETWTSLPFPRDFSLAFVTRSGAAVTLDASYEGGHPVWNLWRDFGLGNAYREITVRVNGEIADIRASPPELDGADHVYLLGGGAIYRTAEPLR